MIIGNDIYNVDLIEIIRILKEDLQNQNISLFAKYFDSGDDVMVCCPYHKDGQERRPSAGIRKSDGLFHCLACGETHNLPEVIAHCFGYRDVIFGYKWLASRFLTSQFVTRPTIDLALSRFDMPNTAETTAIQYIDEEELDSYRYIHKYMYDRGLTDFVIELFDIGYDTQTDSITFPVKDINGNCLFVARRSVKYKRFDLPSGIDKPLYGLYECFTEDGSSAIYICEGLFDCLRLWCNGLRAVAGFGCLFSDYQIQQINDLPTRHIILALDNDEAGRQATAKLKARVHDKIITTVVLPSNRKDIGECTDIEIQNLEDIF